MLDNKKKISWIFQIIAAIILISAGWMKFKNGHTDIFIFTQLRMEPFGRYLIGILEMLAGLLLLSKNLITIGAILGFGIMCGAIIAHVSFLGFSVLGDNGLAYLYFEFAISFLPCCHRSKKERIADYREFILDGEFFYTLRAALTFF